MTTFTAALRTLHTRGLLRSSSRIDGKGTGRVPEDLWISNSAAIPRKPGPGPAIEPWHAPYAEDNLEISNLLSLPRSAPVATFREAATTVAPA